MEGATGPSDHPPDELNLGSFKTQDVSEDACTTDAQDTTCDWKLPASPLTYFAAEFLLHNVTAVVYEPEPRARWLDARIHWESRLFLLDGAVFNRYSSAYPTCDQGDATLNDCPHQDLDHVSGGRFEGSAGPGRLVLLYAAFGASELALEASISFNRTVEVVQAERGRAELLLLLDESGSGKVARGGETWKRMVSVDAPVLVMAHPMRVGAQEIHVVSPHTEARFAASSPGWVAPEGWPESPTLQVMMPGPSGSWRVEALVKENERPGAVLLGWMADPFLAGPGGLFHGPPWSPHEEPLP